MAPFFVYKFEIIKSASCEPCISFAFAYPFVSSSLSIRMLIIELISITFRHSCFNIQSECFDLFYFDKMPKGTCKFTEKLRGQYPYMRTTKSDSDVECGKCRGNFSIASGGITEITRHLKSAKHQAALSAASSSQPLNTYFKSSFDAERAAQEGTWAYHIVSANQSFASSDCATNIFQLCFGLKEFSCAQTKCQAIIKNVIAPHVMEIVSEDLKKCNYVTMYTDASNHGSTKLFPIVIRYFSPTTGVHVKVLEFTAAEGESSDIITNLISTAVNKYGLGKKVTAFCADNAKVNFGGDTRGGRENVFFKLKETFPHLLGINCAAHVTHNALKHGCLTLAEVIEVESIVCQIYSHYYIYTGRTEALKQFCAKANVKYDKLLGYAKTRFLALGPAIKRIVKVYDGLKSYFLSEENEKYKTLRNFFANPRSKFWLMFVQQQVRIHKQTFSI